MSDKWTLRCPDCDAELVVDAATGELLIHRPAKREPAGGKDFETLFAEMEEDREKAEATFSREVEAFRHRDRLLEEKFQEALRRAEEEPDDGPPPRPFDLD